MYCLCCASRVCVYTCLAGLEREESVEIRIIGMG